MPATSRFHRPRHDRLLAELSTAPLAVGVRLPALLALLLLLAGSVVPAAIAAAGDEYEARRSPGLRLDSDGNPDVPAMIDDVVRHYHAEGLFNGSVLVTRDGERLYAGHFGQADAEAGVPNSADTRYRLGSIGKQFTATAIMLLQQDGKLDVHDTVAQHLPDWKWKPADRVTLHHLLTHTSGFPRSVFDFVSGGITRTYTLDKLMRALRRARLDFEPGTDFQYSNAGFTVLVAVVEAVSGRTHNEFIRNRILDPAVLTQTHFDEPALAIDADARGYVATAPGELKPARRISMSFGIGAGTYRTTTGDMVKWDAVLRSGELLTAETQALMYTPGLDPDGDGLGYGYAWNVGSYTRGPGQSPGRLISHGGGIDGFTTSMSRRLDDREVIMVMSNREGAPSDDIARQIALVLERGTPASLARSGLRVVWQALQQGSVAAALEARESLARNEHGRLNTPGQMIGPPDSDSRSTWGHCWFPRTREDVDTAELEYGAPVTAVRLHIHGTADQGGLTQVLLHDAETGEWLEVAVDGDQRTGVSKADGLGVTSLAVDLRRPVDVVRLQIDSSRVQGSNVVDAVGLQSADGTVAWAVAAEATSDRRAIAFEMGFDPPTEDALNTLGYTLLQSGRVDEAVAVFQLNVAAHPEAWNPHDSLGEGYMQRGDDALAIESYERSLELNPQNDIGRRALVRLRQRARASH